MIAIRSLNGASGEIGSGSSRSLSGKSTNVSAFPAGTPLGVIWIGQRPLHWKRKMTRGATLPAASAARAFRNGWSTTAPAPKVIPLRHARRVMRFGFRIFMGR